MGREEMMWRKPKKKPICMEVPGQAPIELVEYYQEFSRYYPTCEMATKRWFVDHVGKDWVILDCGANIGQFSILFSRLAPQGKVYAFEPTSTISMLQANLDHHGVTNVSLVNVALGKASGKRKDGIYRVWGEKPEKRVYPFLTIDDFVEQNGLSRVDCIKIDVDSFDFEVLQGSVKTLMRFNPYVMVELNHALSRRNQSNTQALEWMAGLGYTNAMVLDYDNFLFKRGPAMPSGPANSLSMSLVFAKEGM